MAGRLLISKQGFDGGGGAFHGVAHRKAGMGPGGHGGALDWGEFQPAAEKAFSAFQSVIVDQASAIGLDVRPDVDLIANEDGAAGREGFRNYDAEVLLVRGEHKSVRSPQRAPFAIAGEHAWPVDAIGKFLFSGDLLEFSLETDLIGASYYQVDLRKLRSESNKSVEEEIAAFLLVEARHEEQVASVSELGNRAEEGFDLEWVVAARLADAVGNGEAVPVIGAKAGAGQIALDGGGEENGAGIAQDGILERPVEQLLQVFEWVFFVEPGIEGAVGEDGIGLSGTTRGGTDRDVGEDPDAIHHDAIEAGGILAEPTPQAWRKTKAAEPALAESVNRKWECGEERSVGWILRKDLNLDTYRKIGFRQLTHGFGWATIGWRETSNDVKNSHGSQRRTTPVYLRRFAVSADGSAAERRATF